MGPPHPHVFHQSLPDNLENSIVDKRLLQLGSNRAQKKGPVKGTILLVLFGNCNVTLNYNLDIVLQISPY